MAEDITKQDGQSQSLSSGLLSVGAGVAEVGLSTAALFRLTDQEALFGFLNNSLLFKDLFVEDLYRDGSYKKTAGEWVDFFQREFHNFSIIKNNDKIPLEFSNTSIFDLANEITSLNEYHTSIPVYSRLHRNAIMQRMYQNEIFSSIKDKNVRQYINDLLEKAYELRDKRSEYFSLSLALPDELKEYSKRIDALLKIMYSDLTKYAFSSKDLKNSTFLYDNSEYKEQIEQKAQKTVEHYKDVLEDPETILNFVQKNENKKLNLLLQDRALTLKELLERKDEIKLIHKRNPVQTLKSVKEDEFEQLENILKNLKKKYANDEKKMKKITQIEDTEISSIRVASDGKLYSIKNAQKIFSGILNELANTSPGRLLFVRNFLEDANQPARITFKRGSFNPVLAKAEKVGSDKFLGEGYLGYDIEKIGDKYYVVKQGQFIYLKESSTFSTLSTTSGSYGAVLKEMYAYGEDSNKLDFNPNFRIKHLQKEKINEILGDNLDYFIEFNNSKISDLPEMYERVVHNKEFINYVTGELSSRDLIDLKNIFNKDLDSTIDKNFLFINSSKITDIIKNQSLHGFIVNNNFKILLDKFRILPPERKATIVKSYIDLDSSDLSDAGTRKISFDNLLKKEAKNELIYEYFFQKQVGNNDPERILKETFDTLEKNFGKDSKKTLEFKDIFFDIWLEHFSKFSGNIKEFHDYNEEKVRKPISNYLNLIQTPTAQEHLKNIKERFSTDKTKYHSTRIGMKRVLPQYFVVQKTGSPIAELIDSGKQINEINLGFKEAAKRAIYPFIGGSGNEKYLDRISIFSYFFMSRLNRDISKGGANIFGTEVPILSNLLEKVDFNFGVSHGNRSFASLSKNLLLKRVLPVVGIYSLYNQLSDYHQVITGQSIGTTMYASAANVNLGVRKILDVTGLTGFLKSVKKANPIWQYLDNSDSNFNSYEEQLNYYRNGYDPVRKGCFWAWGSASELRGKAIEYWRPNTLRELSADAYDKVMYNGDMWKKWSHSYIPNIFNPISPLYAIADPYYLEKMHYYDRPYPYTAPMFTEGTPWGTFLNPTIGALLKPVRRMHQEIFKTGVDPGVLINAINLNIKRKARNQANDNTFVYHNGKLEPMVVTTYDSIFNNRYNTQVSNTQLPGITIDEYLRQRKNKESKQSYELSSLEKIQIKAGSSRHEIDSVVSNIINSLNYDIKKQAAQQKIQTNYFGNIPGVLTADKLKNQQDDFLKEVEKESDIYDALHSKQGMGMVRSNAISLRMIGGIYGWGVSLFGDYGETNRPHIQNAGDMTSFSRTFSDASVGGLGGDVMEIARRFIPTYARYTAINPILNTMPSWLPANFRMGDPYTKVPKGEERLPGRGYEALHSLHPDQFGRYGALDRYAILSDIAPFSAETKIWKKIAAKEAMLNPDIKDEFNEIRKRAIALNTKTDFYDYQFLHRSIKRQEGVISEILPRGKFKLVNDPNTYSFAGITPINTKDTLANTIQQYMRPGDKVLLKVDSNPAYARQKDTVHSISAAVYVDGKNINQEMLKNKDAKEKQSDHSAAAVLGNYGPIGHVLGAAAEFIAHADIPLIHSQFLNVNSPLESYKREHVYGVPYQTWSSFYATYIRPAFESQLSSPTFLFSKFFLDYVEKHRASNAKLRKYANYAFLFSDRGAFVGHVLGKVIKLNSSGSETVKRKLRNIGHSIGVLASLQTSYQFSNPIMPAASYASAGKLVFDMLDPFLEGKYMKQKYFTAIAGGIGLLRWATSSKSGLNNGRGTWIPENTKRVWALNDYFDRLTYIKMMGLYHKAARLAKSEEGVDIDKFFRLRDKDDRDKQKTKEILYNLNKEISQNPGYQRDNAMALINRKTKNISADPKVILKGGIYTKSAILYRQAAESTMYGLKDEPDVTGILRALPQQDRDYFMEFMKETDKNKRLEILKYVSPQLRRGLQLIWRMPLDEKISNDKYFKKHRLPDTNWRGWRPKYQLNDIKAKIVKNEGLNFSDFGIYESAYRKPSVINAPNISGHFNNGGTSSLMLQVKLKSILNGLGLTDCEVAVDQSSDSSINVKTSIVDKKTLNVQNLFSGIAG